MSTYRMWEVLVSDQLGQLLHFRVVHGVAPRQLALGVGQEGQVTDHGRERVVRLKEEEEAGDRGRGGQPVRRREERNSSEWE